MIPQNRRLSSNHTLLGTVSTGLTEERVGKTESSQIVNYRERIRAKKGREIDRGKKRERGGEGMLRGKERVQKGGK